MPQISGDEKSRWFDPLLINYLATSLACARWILAGGDRQKLEREMRKEFTYQNQGTSLHKPFRTTVKLGPGSEAIVGRVIYEHLAWRSRALPIRMLQARTVRSFQKVGQLAEWIRRNVV